MRYLEMDAGTAAMREGPAPELAPGCARVRVLACGICGTDLHLLRGMVLPPGASYPIRPGHEVAGIVEEVSALGTTAGATVDAGDLAVLHPLATCGDCVACRRGEDSRCEAPRVLGLHDPGGLGDTVVWPATRMLPANGIAPAAAALLADAAATAHHAVMLAELPPEGTLCVLGAGGVGTSVLELARVLAPSVRLAAVVRTEGTAARVAELGVEVCLGLAGAARELRRRVGRADAVIDFSGDAAAPAVGAALLRRGGRLVLGSVVDAGLELGPSSAFMTRELQVVGAYCSSIRDLAAVIALVHEGRLNPDGWVSHRFPLAEAPTALALAQERPAGMIRVVVEAG
jgi:2-desacetyl-2-hydroxyethyl bacteriochlorophyllide A dehydrogenase